MQLFEALGVDSYESSMSFSLSAENGGLEWGSHGLSSFFVQKSNVCSPGGPHCAVKPSRSAVHKLPAFCLYQGA